MSSKEIEDLRLKDLSLVDLDQFESVIEKTYKSFSEVVGPIAAAKTLHLVCPSFFPLWDNAIADAVRNERGGRKDEKFSPADYYNFIKDAQTFAIRYQPVLSELANRYKKGKLRILDEFFWWMAHRSMSIFLA